MLSCNESQSECTESESSEQFFECNENPSFTDRIEPITTPENLQQPIKFESNLTNIPYMRSSSVPKAEPVSLPRRKISLEHRIDIEDNEPPLVMDALSPNNNIKLTEVFPVRLQAKDTQVSNATDSQDSSPNDPPTEIALNKTEVKASPSEISPPLADIPQDADTQKQSPETPKEVKKSQNLSTEFDLGEQLQKILGISSEKTRVDSSTDKKPVIKEVKISDDDLKVPSVKIDSPDSQKARYVFIYIYITIYTSIQGTE